MIVKHRLIGLTDTAPSWLYKLENCLTMILSPYKYGQAELCYKTLSKLDELCEDMLDQETNLVFNLETQLENWCYNQDVVNNLPHIVFRLLCIARHGDEENEFDSLMEDLDKLMEEEN